MLTRATSHWPTTKGAAGNGLSLSRSIASNSERRLPSRGGANGRLFHSSIFSASAALASASEKNCRWRSGASTHISTSLTAFSADGLSRGDAAPVDQRRPVRGRADAGQAHDRLGKDPARRALQPDQEPAERQPHGAPRRVHRAEHVHYPVAVRKTSS